MATSFVSLFYKVYGSLIISSVRIPVSLISIRVEKEMVIPVVGSTWGKLELLKIEKIINDNDRWGTAYLTTFYYFVNTPMILVIYEIKNYIIGTIVQVIIIGIVRTLKLIVPVFLIRIVSYNEIKALLILTTINEEDKVLSVLASLVFITVIELRNSGVNVINCSSLITVAWFFTILMIASQLIHRLVTELFTIIVLAISSKIVKISARLSF